MNTREIEELLTKYDEGETTLSEERKLKDFFNGPDVPEHLKSCKAMFRYFDNGKKEKLTTEEFDAGTDRRLEETRVLPMNAGRNRLLYVSSLAAGVLLVIGLFFTFRSDVFKKYTHNDPMTDPVYAYAEVQQALLTVSSNLNIGLDQFERLEPIGKTMENVQKLSKFYQYQPIIINPDLIPEKSIKSMKP